MNYPLLAVSCNRSWLEPIFRLSDCYRSHSVSFPHLNSDSNFNPPLILLAASHAMTSCLHVECQSLSLQSAMASYSCPRLVGLAPYPAARSRDLGHSRSRSGFFSRRIICKMIKKSKSSGNV
ncbi:hypothetical protein J6590_084745 [Homalodisca vitripennis]|nr:hypothetical protein J6590_084745 [Homalodisca vitripennis]